MNNQEKAGYAFFVLSVIVTCVWLFVFPSDYEKAKNSHQMESASSISSLTVPPEESFPEDASSPAYQQPAVELPGENQLQSGTVNPEEIIDRSIVKQGTPPLPVAIRSSIQQKNAAVKVTPAPAQREHVTLPYEQLREMLNATLKMENQEERRVQLEELGAILARDDTSIALDILDQLENQKDMQTFVSGFLTALYTEVPGEAVYWISQITDKPLSLFAHNLIAKQWVEHDIQTAYEWALQLEDTGNRLEVLEVIGKTLAKEDPQSTMEWALQFDDETIRTKLVANTIATWSVQDMIGLANWTIRLPETEENNVIIARQFNLWTQFSPEKASQWAVKIDDHDLMTKAVTTVARFWARSNSKQAADWLLATNRIDSEKQIAALSSIVQEWSKNAPKAADDWLTTVTDPEIKNRSPQSLFPNEAVTLMQLIPPAPPQGVVKRPS